MRKSLAIGLGILLAGGTVWAQQYLITTVAGGALPPTPATAVSVALVKTLSVAADAGGNVYFAATNSVFRVDAAGVLTRVAGSSTVLGYSGDGGLATSARLNSPTGVALDGAGNVYIADTGNFAIRKVEAATGIITTVAGNGSSGYSGDGGPATSAQLQEPRGVAVDGSGNLYIADNQGNAIRKVVAETGIITTVAGNGTPGYSGNGGPATSAQFNQPGGVAVDGSGNLYIADYRNSAIRKVAAATGRITTIAGNGAPGYSGDGGLATSARLAYPRGVAVDGSGNLYIADADNNMVRAVAAVTGIITTVAGSGTMGYSDDGGPAVDAQLVLPLGVAVDGSGNLYIAESVRIRKVAAATGIITTVAGSVSAYPYSGDGGPAANAQLSYPGGLAADSSGNLYIARFGNSRVRKVTASTGMITTVAGNGAHGYSGDGGPATSAQLGFPGGMAVDGSGNLYICDTDNSVIRKVMAATGIITTLAGNGSSGYSGDGGPAISAQLDHPGNVAVDGAGNLYISDSGRLRKVAAATGIIATVAGNGTTGYSGDGGLATSAQLSGPGAVAVDGLGNLYIVESGRIRKVTVATGIITTVAGNGTQAYSGDAGPATSAQLLIPTGVAVDGSGNLYIAESGRIRKVAAATGIITTMAGNGRPGDPGDGGPATNAHLFPRALAMDAAGNLYIDDYGNNVIRMLVPVATRALPSVTLTHAANFVPGQTGASYAIAVGNPSGAGSTSGTLTVTEIVPAGLTLLYMSGWGWTCSNSTCTSNYALDPGASYPPIIVTVNVAEDAPPQVLNQVTVSGGGAWAAGAGDLTTIVGALAGCTYTVNPPQLVAAPSGGSLTATIQTGSACAWTIQNLPDWITVSGKAQGSGSSFVTLAVAANSGLPRAAQVFVAGVPVTVYQGSNVLFIAAGGIVNAATYTVPVAPGSIAAVFGDFLLAAPLSASSLPLPTGLGGLSLQFGGGVLAPLFYADPGQANVQIPWELAGQSQTTIMASRNGQTSAPQTVNLSTYAPGIFTTGIFGTGSAAILDSNNRLISPKNPTRAGDIIQIYCTGLGPVTNQPATGAPSPANPLAHTTTLPTVMISGVPSTVQFSGLTPGDVGLYQVNAQVPAAVSGSTAMLTISIGGATSNTVTIPVR